MNDFLVTCSPCHLWMQLSFERADDYRCQKYGTTASTFVL